MSGFLGLDPGPARGLADDLAAWPAGVDGLIATITAAERRADVVTGTITRLDEIGADGQVMASAIREAASTLESFTLSLDQPLALSNALASVQSFAGTDNDPELDRRVRELRGLVEHTIDDPDDAALVLSHLLALDQAGDLRHRDLSAVDDARRELDRLAALAATGAISDNDPRIDDAMRTLRSQVSPHVADPADVHAVVGALLDDPSIDTLTVMAATLHDIDQLTVAVAHANGVDYDVAAGLIDLARVDEITASMQHMSSPAAIDAAAAERAQILQRLSGTDDPLVPRVLVEQLGNGATAAEAFRRLETQLERHLRAEQVDEVAALFDLDEPAAARRLDQMEAEVRTLVDAGWVSDDAARVVQFAHATGADLGNIERVAVDEQLSLVDAATMLGTAEAYAMTLDEYHAYDGLTIHFDALDSAITGDLDGIVSLDDLEHVAAHPDDFPADVVAAATALIGVPTLRHRLDTARDNDDVLGTDAFGATRADDHRISRDDLDMFRLKQSVNVVLGHHLDAIDVANGGDIDQTRRKQDFQAYLDAHRSELTEAEIGAIELVVEAEWYDQTFWQEHGDSIALVAAVVVGGAVFWFTGGLGGGLSAALISTAYAAGSGAATAGSITLAGNALSGDDLDDDLLHNTLAGAGGGLAGAGLVAVPTGLANGSLGIKTVTALGATADVSGLVAAGATDPILAAFLDDIAIADLKRTAETTSLVTGGATLTAGLATAGRHVLGQSDLFTPTPFVDVAGTPPSRHGPSVVYRGDGRTDGIFEAGFTARNPDMSLEDHLAGGNGLIATSRSRFVANGFAIQNNGWIYIIDDPGDGIVIDYAELGFRHLAGEREIAFRRIAPEVIRGAYDLNGNWIPNPNHIPR